MRGLGPLGGQVTSCSRPARPAPHGVSASQTPGVGTVLNTQDGEAGFLRADGTLSPWRPLRLQVGGTWPIPGHRLTEWNPREMAELVPGPMQHARPACTARSPLGHPFREWQPDPETGASCPHPQGTAGHPRALGLRCSEMASWARDQVLRGGNHSAPEKAAAPASRSGASEWAPFQAAAFVREGRGRRLFASGPAPPPQAPAESGFLPAERVHAESMLSPQASPSVCPPGWPPPALSHATPITSAAGTVPAVGVASEHGTQYSQRGKGGKNEREEKTAQVRPQDKQSQERRFWLKVTQTAWLGAGHSPEDTTWPLGIVFNPMGVCHAPTENLPGSWRPF